MPKYQIKLKDRESVARGAMAFWLEKPVGFEFKSGQTFDLTLLNPPETDTEGNSRTFSIAAAPFEADLMFATRLRDTAFKRTLQMVPLGTALEMEGPFGSFTLHNNSSRPAVFLIGGIGITPIYSMLKTAAREKTPHKLFLFYSNRHPEDAAFLLELTDLQKQNPNYQLIAAMTNLADSQTPWDGKTGYITQEMVGKYVDLKTNPIFYLAGPPAMVLAMRKILTALKINDDDIKTEEFSGYE